MAHQVDDGFWLWDLKVETVAGPLPMVCNHPVGSFFTVEGENLIMGNEGSFPLFAMAALLPLLPAKQRQTEAADWMTTDAEVACPDPHCGGRFRITRTQRRHFTNAGTTGRPEARGVPYWQAEHGDD